MRSRRTAESSRRLIAYLVGAFVACLTGGTRLPFSFLCLAERSFFVGPVNGIVVRLSCTSSSQSDEKMR